LLLLQAAGSILAPVASLAQTPPGTEIPNTALATYSAGTVTGLTSASNTVTVVTMVARTPSVLEFLQYAPSAAGAEPVVVPAPAYSASGTDAGPFETLPPPEPPGGGEPLDLAQPVPLVAATVFHQGDPIFVRLTDPDQNLDPLAAETVLVRLSSGDPADSELLRLGEVAPGAGIFAGYIQSTAGMSPVPFDGLFQLAEGAALKASYADIADGSDASGAAIVVDPCGLVFDSATGQPVDGALVTLVDATTGLPATVHGDDGLSNFPATIVSGGEVTDAGGRHYDFPPGGFRFPFLNPGDYRLEVAPPAGFTAPSQVATTVLQALPGGPFAIAEPGSRGEPFSLNPGPAIHLDVPVDPAPATEQLTLEKTVNRELVSHGDFLQYCLRLENHGEGPVLQVAIADWLPLGFRFQSGSVLVAEAPAADPQIAPDGGTLTFSLGTVLPGATVTVRYVVEVAAGARVGEAVNSAQATGDAGVASNLARAVSRVREAFFSDAGFIAGRVIVDNCGDRPTTAEDGLPGMGIYLEDGTYAVTDELGMYHFEGVPPGSHVVQLDLGSLPDGFEPTRCLDNSRFAGSAFSRFVDLTGGILWRCDFHLRRLPEPVPDPVPEPISAEQAQAAASPAVPSFDEAWLATAGPGREWLWPEPEFSPPIPSLKLAVKHHPREVLELWLGGEPVSPLNHDGVRQDEQRGVAVSVWSGVDLVEGDNRLTVVARDQQGTELWRLERVVHYSGPPVFAEFLPGQSTLVADGKTAPKIAVLLTDRDGFPVREGVIGEVRVDPPHRTQQELAAFQRDPLAGLPRRSPTYVVREDGIAQVELQATTRTGEAVLHFRFAEQEQEIRAWLQPGERDWILVGLAEGTVGYNTLSGNLENLAAGGHEEDYYEDGRLAFYAKGRIKGEWLLTVAFDSRKEWETDGNSLHQVIDPDTYYTLYGDATRQEHDAASARKLYLKLERRQFYALFGDFETGLTVNELARYSRSLNGFKAELRSKRLGFNLFASETGHGFVRDEIRGDGTSGLYRLSRRDVVLNSEKVFLETRDRFRSEVILASRRLTRHLDYNIDYDSGTLFCKEPVPSKDAQLNPVFVVVDYETRGQVDSFANFGGRGAVTFGERRLELGATFVHEEQFNGKGELLGCDAHLWLDRWTELKGEYVQSETDLAARHQAYLAELARRAGRLQGRAYLREQESGFGLGHQNLGESGTRKVGLDLRYEFGSAWNWDGKAFRQFNLSTDAERDFAEARLQWRRANLAAHIGWRYACDRFADGSERQSDQIATGASLWAYRKRLQLLVEHEQSLPDRDRNADFPTRTSLGADYRVTEDLTLLSRYEFTSGATETTHGARVGLRASPWTGGQVSTSLERRYSENGSRVFANLGLRQLFRVGSRWNLDVGLDHSRAETGPGHRRFNENVPPASGSPEGFTAASLGTHYRAGKWQWNNRFEILHSDQEDRWSVVPSVLVEPKAGLGLAATARMIRREPSGSAPGTDTDLRLGLAVRPRHTRWTVLNRLRWFSSTARGPTPAAAAGRSSTTWLSTTTRGGTPRWRCTWEPSTGARTWAGGVFAAGPTWSTWSCARTWAGAGTSASSTASCTRGGRGSSIAAPAPRSASTSCRTSGPAWATISPGSGTRISPAAATRPRGRSSGSG